MFVKFLLETSKFPTFIYIKTPQISKRMVKESLKKQEKNCSCNPTLGIIGALLLAAGLYFLVGGFKLQFTSASRVEYVALIFYLIGIIVIWLGKWLGQKSYCGCDMHTN